MDAVPPPDVQHGSDTSVTWNRPHWGIKTQLSPQSYLVCGSVSLRLTSLGWHGAAVNTYDCYRNKADYVNERSRRGPPKRGRFQSIRGKTGKTTTFGIRSGNPLSVTVTCIKGYGGAVKNKQGLGIPVQPVGGERVKTEVWVKKNLIYIYI